MFVACLITAVFLVAGVSAWRLLKGVGGPGTRSVLKVAILCAAVLTPTQVFIGDLHGLNTLEHQPAKVAAMEGIWDTQSGAALTLFGIPDEEQRTTHYALKVPKMASLILTHDLDGEVKGLNDFVGEHPPVAPVFFAFRVMVGMVLLMILVSWLSSIKLLRGRELETTGLRVLVGMTFAGWVAVLAGWYVTEIGRQPWVVNGLIRTADVVADHEPQVLIASLTAYVLIYAFLLVSYISTLFYMSSKPALSLKGTPVHEYDLQSGGRI